MVTCMSYGIEVNTDVLAGLIGELGTLIGDEKLKWYSLKVIAPAIDKSGGPGAAALDVCNAELGVLALGLYNLMEATREFLVAAHGHYVERDEQLARSTGGPSNNLMQ